MLPDHVSTGCLQVSKNTYAVQQQTTLTVNASGYATVTASPDRWPMVSE
jgi:hypothetical protein